jgi:NAD(P)-dependent dehydrogenase (short-subunit alcohol dehydrogenase family)
MTEPYSSRDPSNPFRGLRVAITGGTSGLGLALVRELHALGARVAFVARTRSRVEQVARDLDGVHGVTGDVSLKDDIHPIALQIVGGLGGLDVLVNNASDLGPTPLALLADTDCEALERSSPRTWSGRFG